MPRRTLLLFSGSASVPSTRRWMVTIASPQSVIAGFRRSSVIGAVVCTSALFRHPPDSLSFKIRTRVCNPQPPRIPCMADKRLVLLLAAGSLCLDARPHESVVLSGGAINNPLLHVARALCDPPVRSCAPVVLVCDWRGYIPAGGIRFPSSARSSSCLLVNGEKNDSIRCWK